jgi:hypothetical protein
VAAKNTNTVFSSTDKERMFEAGMVVVLSNPARVKAAFYTAFYSTRGKRTTLVKTPEIK